MSPSTSLKSRYRKRRGRGLSRVLQTAGVRALTPFSAAASTMFLTVHGFVALLITLSSVLGNSIFAQTQNALPPPPATTLKTATRLVGVDVVVTDPQGRPVTGLNQEDFKVEEDNRAQSVSSFEVHAIAPAASYAPLKVPQLPPNTYLNIQNAREVGTPTVILYDALNTLPTDQQYGHAQLLKFIKNRRPGTQIAIFILGAKLHLLQGFTEDTDLLSAVVASRKGGVQTTTVLAPSADVVTTPISPEDPDLDLDQVLTAFREMEELNQEKLQDDRVKITLTALSGIARFFSSLPGRKNLIWLSSSFPAAIMPGPEGGPHDQGIRNYSEQIKQATDLLDLSHVSVYPVDIRGITTNADYSAASNAGYGSNPAPPVPSGVSASRGTATATRFNTLSISRQGFVDREAATRATMDTVADNTGGHAFYGTNGLQEALDSALLSGSTYYSLSYSPTNPKYDGSLRHIKVTLKKSGYTLAYRKTYYADDLEAAARAAADAPVSPLSPALERGTPLVHGLFVEAHLDAAGPPVAAIPSQMQVLSQYEAMRTKNQNAKPQPVMMQNYFISYGLIARQLEMPQDDKGTHQASLEFGMISYDEDGRKLNGLDTRVDDTIPPNRYAKLASDGYHAVQSVAVPVEATSLRLAVRDIHGNHTGSLEVKLPLVQTTDAKGPQTQPPAK